MIALHAHWCPPRVHADAGQLVIWAELGQGAPTGPVDRLGLAQRHPYTAGAARILEILATLAPVAPERGLRDRRILLWLPTRRGLPQASPALGPNHDAEGHPALATWAIDGLALDPAEGLELLNALPSADAAPTGISLADDLRYWQAAARLGLELMARQSLLPGLRLDAADGAARACWLPAWSEQDRDRLHQLTEAMPALCRADAAHASAPAAATHLTSFLETSIDAACRAWILPEATKPQGARESAAARWLAALSGSDGRLPPGPRLDRLRREHAQWIDGLEAPRGADCRLALRLQAPDANAGADATWQLHFLLQALDAPELTASAAAAWKAGETTLDVFGRHFRQPGPSLAEGLAWAERLVPALRRLRRRKRPRKLGLSTREAQAFLEEAAPVLRSAGVAVEAPDWWDAPEARLGVHLKLRTEAVPAASDGCLSLAELVDFEWQVRLGESPLDAAEIEALASARSPLTRVGGRWLRLDPYQLKAAQRILEAGRQRRPLAEALPFGLGAETVVDGLPLEQVASEGWLESSLSLLRGERPIPPLPAPPGLLATLRPYQLHGLAWLDFLRRRAGGGILADDMGLGKTLQLLALLMHLRQLRGGRLPGPVLLLAPTSVVTSWAREAARWTPSLEVHLHQGPERLSGSAFEATCASAELVLTSYALLRHDRAQLEGIHWQGLVLDEAQLVKNPASLQSRIVRSLQADWRFALTGTPVENRLAELWSIFEAILPGYLGPRASFRREIALPIERHRDEVALRRLRQLSSPFILRRLKRDPEIAAELPPKQEVRVYCQLSPEQVLLYESVVREALVEVESSEGMTRRGRVLSMLTQLKQVCNHPAQYLGQIDLDSGSPEEAARSGKLTRLGAMMEELAEEGEAALVFSQYRAMGGLLRSYLRERLGREVLFLHGGQSAELRERIVRRFQDDPDGPPVLVMSLKAGGTGLTLTRASHVFHFDRWWNPAVEDQATDRAYRIGQSRPVTAHKFVCQGTLEDRIDAMLEQKRSLAEQVIGQGERWLTELPAGELRRLVQLDTEAPAR